MKINLKENTRDRLFVIGILTIAMLGAILIYFLLNHFDINEKTQNYLVNGFFVLALLFSFRKSIVRFFRNTFK
jgi:hypothetical protein